MPRRCPGRNVHELVQPRPPLPTSPTLIALVTLCAEMMAGNPAVTAAAPVALRKLRRSVGWSVVPGLALAASVFKELKTDQPLLSGNRARVPGVVGFLLCAGGFGRGRPGPRRSRSQPDGYGTTSGLSTPRRGGGGGGRQNSKDLRNG